MGKRPLHGNSVPAMNPESTPAWQALAAQTAYYAREFDLRLAFAQDSQRFSRLSLRIPHMLVDLSKNLLDQQVFENLLILAEQMGLVEQQAKLLNGEIVNHSEQQAAVHAVLRLAYVSGSSSVQTAMAQNCRDLDTMLSVAEEIRSDKSIHDVVHIGIGGSSLGPELALQALAPFKTANQRLHVVSNLDGQALSETLEQCDPAHTLFIAASKSWSTFETLQNLKSAIDWLQGAGVNVAGRVVAITAKPHAAAAMGVQRILRMPANLGGRYSLWSAVGLPVAVAIGSDGFRQMLAGAAEMDIHFAEAPLAANAPVCLGLLDIWYSSFLQMPSKCVVPYHHGLRRLPAYLQQLEMESNGKSVRQTGEIVRYPTSMAVWGEAGTNGQHAFFQWLHQGTQRIPAEFVASSQASHLIAGHQQPLLANALAQAQALMWGGSASEGQLRGHQDFPGNRPSTFILLEGQLTPASFGALLALYEHRTFVSGVVWGVNSFDQWGVELGKQLARDVLMRMANCDTQGLDASSAGLLQALVRGLEKQQ